MASKHIALVLSGCGVFDGTEIYEAVLAILALMRKGYEIEFLAPDIPQAHVFNHLEGTDTPGEERNVLVEAARLARGKIRPLEDAKPEEFDGAVFPGGFGAAKNLSTFAFDGKDAKVNEQVSEFIRAMHEEKKPLAFFCIAPVVAARALGQGVELTIGAEQQVAAAIEAMGARHVVKQVHEAHVDETHRVCSTPAYMYDAPILEVEKGINACIDEFSTLLAAQPEKAV